MKYISLVILILFVYSSGAQDPFFSQMYGTSLYTNPGFTGAYGCPHLTSGYQNRWPALGSAYSTFIGSYDMYMEKVRS
ncbi:MAG: type IX secretion system membrane protein PorP/SprF, partial [Bacteroidetes bacterium]|nr:type IX secretion system membrane protein PorP/SprF [Bacteroidota bacterium]